MPDNKASKVIFDTNIWVSWLIKKEFNRIDKLILDQKIKLVFSEELFGEFIEVANRPKLKKYFAKNDIQDIVHLIENHSIFVQVNSVVNECRDFKDNFLLALSIDSNADYLVTGDKDLLDLIKFGKTRIITLSDFYSKM